MPRKCHNHRQQTNQWHPEEEIHKVNICCMYSLEASQYETLPRLIEMSPMSAPGICFVAKLFRKRLCCTSNKRKWREENLPPPPPLIHQKRPYTYIARHQENQSFPKPIEVTLKNRLPTCEHKLSHFEPTFYLKSKLQIQNTIKKLPMSTTAATVYTFLSCIIDCMGLGTKMLAANAQRWLISLPVMSITWLKTMKLSRCAVVHRHRPDKIHLYLMAPYPFFEVSEATIDTLHLEPGPFLFRKDTYIFSKNSSIYDF